MTGSEIERKIPNQQTTEGLPHAPPGAERAGYVPARRPMARPGTYRSVVTAGPCPPVVELNPTATRPHGDGSKSLTRADLGAWHRVSAGDEREGQREGGTFACESKRRDEVLLAKVNGTVEELQQVGRLLAVPALFRHDSRFCAVQDNEDRRGRGRVRGGCPTMRFTTGEWNRTTWRMESNNMEKRSRQTGKNRQESAVPGQVGCPRPLGTRLMKRAAV
jgi:hypothetical protein